jgi:signal transduction histidine kinase
VIDTVSYLMIGSVAGRMLPYYLGTGDRWVVIGLLSLYALLFTAARILSRRIPTFLYPYFLIQLAISMYLCLGISSYDGPQDYFAMLVLPLCIQAMWRPSLKKGAIWVGFFSVVMASSMIIYYQKYEQSWEGIGYGLVYVAACVMIAAFSSMTMRAEEAHNRTQALNAELQQANQKLQDYARRVEHMAAVEERARLARDLHDSVSQTIFSMTLTAQAARILLERDPGRVGDQLDHLQELAKNALAEMRALIQHLRLDADQRDGLGAWLRRHVLERELQDGLMVDLTITGERRLPSAVEENLFRVVQEALNNVTRHAQCTSASVTLRLDENPIMLCIEDHGVGFNPASGSASARLYGSHMGIAGMAERVRALGGRLEIDSSPGKGTRVWVTDLVVEEGKYA